MHLPYFIDGEMHVSISPVTDSLESTCMPKIKLTVGGKYISHSHTNHQSSTCMPCISLIGRHMSLSHQLVYWKVCMPQNQADGGGSTCPSLTNQLKSTCTSHSSLMVRDACPCFTSYLLESSCIPQTKWAAGSTCPSPNR